MPSPQRLEFLAQFNFGNPTRLEVGNDLLRLVLLRHLLLLRPRHLHRLIGLLLRHDGVHRHGSAVVAPGEAIEALGEPVAPYGGIVHAREVGLRNALEEVHAAERSCGSSITKRRHRGLRGHVRALPAEDVRLRIEHRGLLRTRSRHLGKEPATGETLRGLLLRRCGQHLLHHGVLGHSRGRLRGEHPAIGKSTRPRGRCACLRARTSAREIGVGIHPRKCRCGAYSAPCSRAIGVLLVLLGFVRQPVGADEVAEVFAEARAALDVGVDDLVSKRVDLLVLAPHLLQPRHEVEAHV
jgi:hypothetical protein